MERAAAKGFRQLAVDYMDKVFPRLAANTIKQRRHHIEDVILPRLGKLAAREVTTADVVDLIESVGKKSGPNVAELVFTALSEIFKHGIARHVFQANPCTGIMVSAVCGKAEPRRQRLKLTEAELRVILPVLPAIGAENALAVKIQLATCVRPGELAKAEWTHVDFDRGEWTIPDSSSKTRKGFTIPLFPPYSNLSGVRCLTYIGTEGYAKKTTAQLRSMNRRSGTRKPPHICFSSFRKSYTTNIVLASVRIT